MRRACAVLLLAATFGSLPVAAVSARAEAVIVAFGTSLTARASWPDELATALGPCFRDGLRMVRVASPGEGSDWGLSVLEDVIAARPNAVLMEFAINDADVSDGVRLSRSRANHLQIIETIRTKVPDARIALMTTHPVKGRRGWLRPWLSDYYDMYRSLAREAQVTLIDLYPLWREALVPNRASELLPDGLHPTDAANREIALPRLTAAVRSLFGLDSDGCRADTAASATR